MVFLKPLEQLDFSDIAKLQSNKICESEILDYKEELIEDNKLLKEVSAFANTQGGFLIFGIKEIGKGTYPEEIAGIDNDRVNSERIEQIILDNIQPRLEVRFRTIQQNPRKKILIIQIPNSHLKPHMNGADKKFYKRYQFEAAPMTETEVNDAYKKRFRGYQETEKYILNLLSSESKREAYILKYSKCPKILGQIILLPMMFSNLISTSIKEEFDWVNHKMKFYPDVSKIAIDDWDFPCYKMRPSTSGVKARINSEGSGLFQEIEIHRNGCISYRGYFQDQFNEFDKFFEDARFCAKLMHNFQFAGNLYQRTNYFGDVKIVCNLSKLRAVNLMVPKGKEYIKKGCQTNTIKVTREFSALTIETKSEWISSGIMDEIYNNFGEWKCQYFDEKGKLKEREVLKNAILVSDRVSKYGYPSYSYSSE